MCFFFQKDFDIHEFDVVRIHCKAIALIDFELIFHEFDVKHSFDIKFLNIERKRLFDDFDVIKFVIAKNC